MTWIFSVCFLVLLLQPFQAAAGDRSVLAGPVAADVSRIIDGDTIEVVAIIWPGMRMETLVRLDGVNTPELRGRCGDEKALARRARDFVSARIGQGRVFLRAIRLGKYAGRVVARVETSDGSDLGRALLREGLGLPYDGKGRTSWCPDIKSPA